MSKSTVIVVGGPAGTGKSTIAELLSSDLSCEFIEGDALHPKANIDKMSQGISLTDEDRWGWLQKLSEVAATKSVDPENESRICIVLCSMLKKVYRELIKTTGSEKFPNQVQYQFVFLYSTFEELMKRVSGRQGHFMKSDMVKSQYDIMEIPAEAELHENGGDCWAVDTTGKTPQELFDFISVQLR